MIDWKVIYYQTARGEEPVISFIKKLPKEDQGKIIWTINLLETHGLRMGSPYLKKIEGTKKLWELKVNKYRIFLSFVLEKNILLIHAIIKKTQKTPKKDLKLIKNRLKSFMEDSLWEIIERINKY